MSLEALKQIIANVKPAANQAQPAQAKQVQPASAKPIEENNASKTEQKADTTSVFDRMAAWRDSHEENTKNTQKRLDDPEEVEKYGYSIIDEYEQRKIELGLEFDFMGGKDPNNEEDYDAQIHELAQGDFDTKDVNHDGVVTFEEYVDNEASSLDEDDDTYTKAITRTYSYLMAALMDQAMGNSNNDGVLSVAEFESFYRNLDSFNGEGFNENGDGKITTADFTMRSWLIDNIFSADTIDKVFDMALEGKI